MIKICGVYAIIAPDESTYIGSSRDCKARWEYHNKELRSGKHQYCKYFQQAFFNKTLQYKLLEECLDSERFELEQRWMDAYPNRVNIHRHVHATGVILTEDGRRRIGNASKARIVSAETKAAISRAGKGREMSAKTKEALIKALTGRPLSEKARAALTKPKSPESRKRIADAIRGKPLSESTRKKLSLAMVGRNRKRNEQGRYC